MDGTQEVAIAGFEDRVIAYVDPLRENGGLYQAGTGSLLLC